MKKFLPILLILLLLLTACGTPDPLPMSTDSANTLEGKLTYTLYDFYRADTVAPSIPTGEYQVYEAPAGQEYLVAVMDVENHAAFGYPAAELLPLTLTAGEAVYTPICLVLTDNGATLTENATIPGQSKARVYYLFTPDTTEGLTMTATIDKQPYTAQVLPADSAAMERTQLGQTLTGNGITVTLDAFQAAQKLKPAAPAPLHNFFDAGSGSTHLILKATVVNYSDTAVDCRHVAGVTVGTTICVPILEAADGSDLADTGTISPGQSRTMYFAAKFPADQATKKATVTISLYADTFRFAATPAGR